MKYEVRKEVICLLDTGAIYPMSGSKWVSPTRVPKKGCLIVMQNDEDKVIPFRTITGYKMFIDFRRLK
jgi:hypothetical protein